MVDCIFDLFDVLPATQVGLAAFGDTGGLPVVTAYLKESTAKTSSDLEKFKPGHPKTPLFSFTPPTSGMFIWVPSFTFLLCRFCFLSFIYFLD